MTGRRQRQLSLLQPRLLCLVIFTHSYHCPLQRPLQLLWQHMDAFQPISYSTLNPTELLHIHILRQTCPHLHQFCTAQMKRKPYFQPTIHRLVQNNHLAQLLLEQSQPILPRFNLPCPRHVLAFLLQRDHEPCPWSNPSIVLATLKKTRCHLLPVQPKPLSDGKTRSCHREFGTRGF